MGSVATVAVEKTTAARMVQTLTPMPRSRKIMATIQASATMPPICHRPMSTLSLSASIQEKISPEIGG